jgi:hypothetical protein
MSGQLNDGQLNDGQLNDGQLNDGQLHEPAYSLDKAVLSPYPSATSSEEDGELAGWRQAIPEIAAILVIFTVAGACCGVLWQWLWTPPSGMAYHHQWLLDGHGLTSDFAGTGLYAVIAALVGLVLGLVVTLVFDHDEVFALAALVLGAVAAAAVMWLVGTALGPADPHTVAKTAADFDPVLGDLRVHGKGPFLAFPLGALAGAAISLFFFTGRRFHPRG